MTAAWTVGIVTVSLWAMTVWGAIIYVRLKSRSSTPPSPTPPTTPTPTSPDVVAVMAKMMADTTRQMREMALGLTLGRESPSPNGQQETEPIWNGKQIEYDYDSTPLSPGIEAVLERENEETEQARLLREREELQRALIETQREWERSQLSDQSNPGPWIATSEDPEA